MFDTAFAVLSFLNSEEVFGLVLLLLVGLFVGGWQNWLSRQAVPGLMTSVGIFGTFWGVFIALYPLDFAPDKMTESIEALVDGMKTAFVTSLVGMGSGILTKAFWSRGGTNTAKKSWSPEHQDIAKRLDAIKDAIAGGDSSSMVEQLKSLRTDTNDGFKKLDGLAEAIQGALIKNLENLIAQVQSLVSEQLGSALQNLVEEIQKALIEQFGKTFVQFNEAVQALKKWQEDHRGHVEQMTEAFNESARGIQSIRENCATIPETMGQVAQIVGTVNGQLDALTKHLTAFAEMREQAASAFPEIRDHLNQIGADLQKGADTMRTSLENSITKIGETFAKEMNDEADRVLRLWGDNMAAIAEQVEERIRAVGQDKTI
ncbi:MAG: MotA/TolQ/ExbB proton channel family protein [Alphaproteobacteria bacterium]|nr:MotA/TolQ/ExbB proton channel family protein [Alphaproteobacteria bacterium]